MACACAASELELNTNRHGPAPRASPQNFEVRVALERRGPTRFVHANSAQSNMRGPSGKC
eukprot:2208212-Prymnesium_polylepis.1